MIISPRPSGVTVLPSSHKNDASQPVIATYEFRFQPSSSFYGTFMFLFAVVFPFALWVFQVELSGNNSQQQHMQHAQSPQVYEYRFPLPVLALSFLFGIMGLLVVSSYPWSRLVIEQRRRSDKEEEEATTNLGNCYWEQVFFPIFLPFKVPLLTLNTMEFPLERIEREVEIVDSGWRKSGSGKKFSHQKRHERQLLMKAQQNELQQQQNETTTTTTTGEKEIPEKKSSTSAAHPSVEKNVVYDVRLKIAKSQKEIESLTRKSEIVRKKRQDEDGFADPVVEAQLKAELEKNSHFSIILARQESADVLAKTEKEWNMFIERLKGISAK